MPGIVFVPKCGRLTLSFFPHSDQTPIKLHDLVFTFCSQMHSFVPSMMLRLSTPVTRGQETLLPLVQR